MLPDGTGESTRRARAASFGAAADRYERARPSYPVEAVRWALPPGAQRVLDLGAGTGKLTAVLLGLGLDVVAVEPSAPMRAHVPGQAEVLAGTAEQVPLPDADVDAVLVGQAFHWFEPTAALAEVARVLRPGGTLGLLWNVRDESAPWVREVWAEIESGDDLVGQPFAAQSGLGTPVGQHFPYEQQLDADLLVDLAASRSALLVMPDAQRAQVLERVRRLAPTGSFVLPYVTEVWRSVRA